MYGVQIDSILVVEKIVRGRDSTRESEYYI